MFVGGQEFHKLKPSNCKGFKNANPVISSKNWPRKATSGAFGVAGFRWKFNVFRTWPSRHKTPENAAQTHRIGGISGDALGVHLHRRSPYCLKSKASIFNAYRLHFEYGMKVQNRPTRFLPSNGTPSIFITLRSKTAIFVKKQPTNVGYFSTVIVMHQQNRFNSS